MGWYDLLFQLLAADWPSDEAVSLRPNDPRGHFVFFKFKCQPAPFLFRYSIRLIYLLCFFFCSYNTLCFLCICCFSPSPCVFNCSIVNKIRLTFSWKGLCFFRVTFQKERKTRACLLAIILGKHNSSGCLVRFKWTMFPIAYIYTHIYVHIQA